MITAGQLPFREMRGKNMKINTHKTPPLYFSRARGRRPKFRSKYDDRQPLQQRRRQHFSEVVKYPPRTIHLQPEDHIAVAPRRQTESVRERANRNIRFIWLCLFICL